MSFPVSYIADLLVNNGHLRLLNVRRLSQLMGLGGPAILFVGLAFVGCNKTLTIAILCIALALSAGKYTGHGINPQDMSPNYAGTIVGIANTVASCAGFASPIVTGYLTDGQV